MIQVIRISHQAIATHKKTPRFGLIGSPIARNMGGVSEE
jgi:hypothetical protein